MLYTVAVRGSPAETVRHASLVGISGSVLDSKNTSSSESACVCVCVHSFDIA